MKDWEVGDSVPLLTRDSCQIWWARITDIQPWHYDLLNETERERANLFHHSHDQARFIIGCVISRLVLGVQIQMLPYQVPIDRTCSNCKLPHGRPQLPNGMPHFSVSHSGEIVGVAFTASTPVGFDVEQLKPKLDVATMSEGVLTDLEFAQIKKLTIEEQVKGFLIYWTRKESLLKATGEGLTIQPSNVSVSSPASSPQLLLFKNKPELVESTSMIDLYPETDYVAALSILSKDVKEIRQFHAKQLLDKNQNMTVSY
ncbi:4'-phosphopantetheinyl transferase family protein [Bacillus sp. BP-3]|uniref:4'-phosphopantetheinyl transferase family protein n=1 Tax=Bacillus sp. BP-3 TaxID=3022773 RepID=UPI00232B862B|nr:4'-phosphopantetheinyl transferase superfamily protein [Bacillus sp. BP-3]MDC2864276.1 4'-phosphopantetheinyl transferase superfamily protein [Bacillus sp. BP-3]